MSLSNDLLGLNSLDHDTRESTQQPAVRTAQRTE